MRSIHRLYALVGACIIVYLIVSVITRVDIEENENGFTHHRHLLIREDKLPFPPELKQPENPVLPPMPPTKVVIYAATKFFNMDITTERFLSNCHSTKGYCRISENPNDLEIADAVLFHNADYAEFKVPKPRKSNRPHVLWSLESPANDGFRPGPHIINWTMTFRKDADVWYPYGHFEKLPEPVDVNLEEIWALKDSKKTATWLASNCRAANGRQEIISKMEQMGLNVDRWGSCGNPPPNCNGVDKQGYDCVIDLIKPYKFYISLENSNCKDYITEKFYETLYSRMAVPIVLSRKMYEDVGAPGSAFIAVDDFSSIGGLVQYVKEVANNKEEYLKYHKWRNTHRVYPEHDDTTGFCELCRRLQNPDRGSKSYEDVAGWHKNNMCDNNLGYKYL